MVNDHFPSFSPWTNRLEVYSMFRHTHIINPVTMGCPSASEILRSQPPVGHVGLVGRPRRVKTTPHPESAQLRSAGTTSSQVGEGKVGPCRASQFCSEIRSGHDFSGESLIFFNHWNFEPDLPGLSFERFWKALRSSSIWRFPKMGVTPNHRFYPLVI